MAVFLDYDGTLTPIVSRPELAVLSESMRQVLRELAAKLPVAIITGRDRQDAEALVQLPELVYAGSSGFDIAGPGGLLMQYEPAKASLPSLERAQSELSRLAHDIPGVLLERKRFGLSVHYRNVAEAGQVDALEAAVDAVVAADDKLQKTLGKKLFELRPKVNWDKGRAVRWLLETVAPAGQHLLPLYVGDDVTDEDAFGALEADGLGIVVGAPQYPTRAAYALRDTAAVEQLLRWLCDHARGGAGTWTAGS